MKKVLSIFITILISTNIFSAINKKNQILDVNIGLPIVISLINKHDGGSWVLKNKPDGIELQSNRKGYLKTYFFFKSTKIIQGPITFEYTDGKTKAYKTYFIRVHHDLNKVDLRKESKSENDLVIVTEDSKRHSTLKMPKNAKLYINNLVEEKLYDKALQEILKIKEMENKSIDNKWLLIKRIEILEKKKDFKTISTIIQSQLDESSEIKIDDETEFLLRLKKANSDYQTGEKEKSWSQLIFLKNYYPDNANVYYELGKFYFKEGMIKKGVSMFEYMASKFDNPPAKEEVYYTLAKYYYKTVGLNGYHLSYKYYQKIVNIGIISLNYQEAKKMSTFLKDNFINIR